MHRLAVFRVSEVLVGHSAAAAIVGVDAEGRQVRIEVPAIEAATVQPGHVLVLGWTATPVPELAEASPSTVTPQGVVAEPIDELGLFAETGALAARDDDDAEAEGLATMAEFRALMGLG